MSETVDLARDFDAAQKEVARLGSLQNAYLEASPYYSDLKDAVAREREARQALEDRLHGIRGV